MLFQAISKK